MNVFLLIEEKEQTGFVDSVGEEAYPTSLVYGVYQNRDKAEKDRDRLNGTDEKLSYYVEERPVV